MQASYDAMAGEHRSLRDAGVPLVTVRAPVTEVKPVKRAKRQPTSSQIARREGRKLARLASDARQIDGGLLRRDTDILRMDGETIHGGTVSAETLTVIPPKPVRKVTRTPRSHRQSLPDGRYVQGAGIQPDTLIRSHYDVHNIDSGEGLDYLLERQAWADVARRKDAARKQANWARKHAAKPIGEHIPGHYGTLYTASNVLRS